MGIAHVPCQLACWFYIHWVSSVCVRSSVQLSLPPFPRDSAKPRFPSSPIPLCQRPMPSNIVFPGPPWTHLAGTWVTNHTVLSVLLYDPFIHTPSPEMASLQVSLLLPQFHLLEILDPSLDSGSPYPFTLVSPEISFPYCSLVVGSPSHYTSNSLWTSPQVWNDPLSSLLKSLSLLSSFPLCHHWSTEESSTRQSTVITLF